METLEDRIKKSRKYKGLTQPQLAKKTGVSHRTITTYEKNASKITVALSQKIASECAVDFVWLLTGHGTPQGHSSNDDSDVESSQLKRQLEEIERDFEWAIEMMKMYERGFTQFMMLLDQAGIDTSELRNLRKVRTPERVRNRLAHGHDMAGTGNSDTA